MLIYRNIRKIWFFHDSNDGGESGILLNLRLLSKDKAFGFKLAIYTMK